MADRNRRVRRVVDDTVHDLWGRLKLGAVVFVVVFVAVFSIVALTGADPWIAGLFAVVFGWTFAGVIAFWGFDSGESVFDDDAAGQEESARRRFLDEVRQQGPRPPTP